MAKPEFPAQLKEQRGLCTDWVGLWPNEICLFICFSSIVLIFCGNNLVNGFFFDTLNQKQFI